MTAYTIEPVNHVAGVALARAFGPVPQGQEWSVAIRVNNTGAADDSVVVQLRRTDGSNAGFRANGKSLPKGCDPYDVDTRLTLPAGYELWDSSAYGSVSVSYSGTFRSTAN